MCGFPAFSSSRLAHERRPDPSVSFDRGRAQGPLSTTGIFTDSQAGGRAAATHGAQAEWARGGDPGLRAAPTRHTGHPLVCMMGIPGTIPALARPLVLPHTKPPRGPGAPGPSSVGEGRAECLPQEERLVLRAPLLSF